MSLISYDPHIFPPSAAAVRKIAKMWSILSSWLSVQQDCESKMSGSVSDTRDQPELDHPLRKKTEPQKM